MSKTYLCPLCKKQTAYSSYGFPSSIICKCQGLKEVGVIKNNQYVPHSFSKSSVEELSFMAGEYYFQKLMTVDDVSDCGYIFDLDGLKNLEQVRKMMNDGYSFWTTVHKTDPSKNILFTIKYNKSLNKTFLFNSFLKSGGLFSGSEFNFLYSTLKSKNMVSDIGSFYS